ncbi:hypothetical protein ABEG18_06430 [Alsobacter sp. KACC 23698]|uniref:Uncharacterized protein n=1 Tax=Alsobacter sp. KACC 23698 TaxID=3149229 RepID=A0AAU7JJ41_9HYPH
MALSVLPFLRPGSARADWSNQELAEFYRVEAVLSRAGVRVETDRGRTDEGDPWFVFCREETGEVVIHLARYDGRYVVASPVVDGVIAGRDFRAIIEQLIAAHPVVMPAAGEAGKLRIHPSALLVALVMTFLFKTFSADAFAGESPEGAGGHVSELAPQKDSQHGVEHAPLSIVSASDVDERHAPLIEQRQSALYLMTIAMAVVMDPKPVGLPDAVSPHFLLSSDHGAVEQAAPTTVARLLEGPYNGPGLESVNAHSGLTEALGEGSDLSLSVAPASPQQVFHYREAAPPPVLQPVGSAPDAHAAVTADPEPSLTQDAWLANAMTPILGYQHFQPQPQAEAALPSGAAARPAAGSASASAPAAGSGSASAGTPSPHAVAASSPPSTEASTTTEPASTTSKEATKLVAADYLDQIIGASALKAALDAVSPAEAVALRKLVGQFQEPQQKSTEAGASAFVSTPTADAIHGSVQNVAVLKSALDWFIHERPDFEVIQTEKDYILFDSHLAAGSAREMYTWELGNGSSIAIVGSIPESVLT